MLTASLQRSSRRSHSPEDTRTDPWLFGLTVAFSHHGISSLRRAIEIFSKLRLKACVFGLIGGSHAIAAAFIQQIFPNTGTGWGPGRRRRGRGGARRTAA